MQQRIAAMLDSLGLAHLRGRRLETLSGGERQRVAIGAVLTLQPRLLVAGRAHLADRPGRCGRGPRGAGPTESRVGPDGRSSANTVWSGYCPTPTGFSMCRGRPAVTAGPATGHPGTDRGSASCGGAGEGTRWDPLPLSVEEARAHTRGALAQADGGEESGNSSGALAPCPCSLPLAPASRAQTLPGRLPRAPSWYLPLLLLQRPPSAAPGELGGRFREIVALMGATAPGRRRFSSTWWGSCSAGRRVEVAGLDTRQTGSPAHRARRLRPAEPR